MRDMTMEGQPLHIISDLSDFAKAKHAELIRLTRLVPDHQSKAQFLKAAAEWRRFYINVEHEHSLRFVGIGVCASCYELDGNCVCNDVPF